MELEVFKFTNESLAILKKLKNNLNHSSDFLDEFFFNLLNNSCDGFFNISTRVKSSSSLKEKIIRNNYYLKYKTPEELFYNLSDLIGIRIECRFIEDEDKIFKFLKSSFSLTNSQGFSFHESNKNIFLDLRDEQPLKQKNGFKLYRIDGYILSENHKFNFELQIKSMVNIFWSEIEHKVIYKNYNMILGDTFYKNILSSIKSNLGLIDNQLLTIYNHITSNNFQLSEPNVNKEGIEVLLSKMIFDIYSYKVKNELGVSIDFRNACDIIMDYIINKNNCISPQDYHKTFIDTSIRLNEIFKNEISFKEKISLEENIVFNSDFSSIIGDKLLKSINNDFHWNLFFKILFEIEPLNDTGDFKNFINYLENIFSNRPIYLNLYLKFSKSEVNIIKTDLLNVICASFLDINSITFIYRDKLNEIFNSIEDHVNFITDNIDNFIDYENNKYLYCKFLHFNILLIFNKKIQAKDVNKFITCLKESNSKIKVTSRGLKYISSLDEDSSIYLSNFMNYLYIK
ncbi:MAG: relA/spoT family protein [Clostridium perfringens]|nr:relA/spoT family protein [Clostridium perfringens]